MTQRIEENGGIKESMKNSYNYLHNVEISRPAPLSYFYSKGELL